MALALPPHPPPPVAVGGGGGGPSCVGIPEAPGVSTLGFFVVGCTVPDWGEGWH